MGALLDGIYDGDMTIGELLTHGDFGLGTFNHLDGEMIILAGVCHHLRSDGSASVAASDDRTPFAAISTSSELHLSLPTTQAFLAANLSPDNIAKQIEQTEGG